MKLAHLLFVSAVFGFSWVAAAGHSVAWTQSNGVLRGVMLPARTLVEGDFQTLHTWGATLARYQMCADGVPNESAEDLLSYMSWLDSKLDHLDRDVLPWARKYGLRIVIDMHFPPGGRCGGGDDAFRMFSDDVLAEAFVACWEKIATRFCGRQDVVYGYDLMNEPVQLFQDRHTWRMLQERAAYAIRRIDAETPIIFETNMWDGPSTFIGFEPFQISNAIYQVHMYKPTAYTHQGIGHRRSITGCYPDASKGWDKNYLRSSLAPVRAFEQKFGAKIYVGEFSAVAWAKGADEWLRDCLSLFEEYGWDWTYHAFREWPGWSVEHVSKKRAVTDLTNFAASMENARKRVLLDGFKGGSKSRTCTTNSTCVSSLSVGAINCGSFGYQAPGNADDRAIAKDWWRLVAESGTDVFFFEDVGQSSNSDQLGNIRERGLDIVLRTAYFAKSIDVIQLPDTGSSGILRHKTNRCRALRVVVDFAGGELALYGVHLVPEGHILQEKKGFLQGGLTPSQMLRQEQFRALIADAGHFDFAVIAGDFNAQNAKEYEFFSVRGWTVANGSAQFGTHATLRNIPADNIVVSPSLAVSWFSVPDDYCLNTDHRPVLARVYARDGKIPDVDEFLTLPRDERVRLFADRRFRRKMLRENYPDGSGLLSRWVKAEAIPNFRDVGGIVNRDGIELCRGVFYRSARWNETAITPSNKPETEWKMGTSLLTRSGRSALSSLGIRTELDLRTSRECWGLNSSPLGRDVLWIHDSFGHYDEIGKVPEFQDAVKTAFSVLADPSRRPVVFHCIGGADRTGTLAFLVQGLCGVDEETLVKDWELTGCYTERLDLLHADCIDRLLSLIARQHGVNIQERIESLLLSCGVSKAEMTSVRAALLNSMRH